MGYQSALEAAGATVKEMKKWGSYQGEWVAKVVYNGEEGYVLGGYGSCSVCDAFEAEFDCGSEDEPDYHERLKSFGWSYLEPLRSLDDIISYFAGSAEFDQDSQEALEYYKTVKREAV